MTDKTPGQNDFEDLSAFVDGELDASRAAEIERLVQTDPRWQRAVSRLASLDRALEALPAPPADPHLADRIIDSVHRRMRRNRLAWPMRIGAALAAAAAIVIVAVAALDYTSRQNQPTGGGQETSLALDKTAGENEELIIQRLDFYRDMEVVEHYETLEAIESLEALSAGT